MPKAKRAASPNVPATNRLSLRMSGPYRNDLRWATLARALRRGFAVDWPAAAGRLGANRSDDGRCSLSEPADVFSSLSAISRRYPDTCFRRCQRYRGDIPGSKACRCICVLHAVSLLLPANRDVAAISACHLPSVCEISRRYLGVRSRALTLTLASGFSSLE